MKFLLFGKPLHAQAHKFPVNRIKKNHMSGSAKFLCVLNFDQGSRRAHAFVLEILIC